MTKATQHTSSFHHHSSRINRISKRSICCCNYHICRPLFTLTYFVLLNYLHCHLVFAFQPSPVRVNNAQIADFSKNNKKKVNHYHLMTNIMLKNQLDDDDIDDTNLGNDISTSSTSSSSSSSSNITGGSVAIAIENNNDVYIGMMDSDNPENKEEVKPTTHDNIDDENDDYQQHRYEKNGNHKDIHQYENMKYFEEYETVMNQVFESFSIMQKKDKEEDFLAAKQYLLSKVPYLGRHSRQHGTQHDNNEQEEYDNNDVHDNIAQLFKAKISQQAHEHHHHASNEQQEQQQQQQQQQQSNDRETFLKCMEKQRSLFIYSSASSGSPTQHNITPKQNEMIARSLTYVGDYCAKHQLYKPLIIAWQKIMECGIKPRINLLSTYLYRLSAASSSTTSSTTQNVIGTDTATNNGNDNHLIDTLVNQVAFYHDMLYSPTENTVAIRIKSYVDKGQAKEAQELLWSLHPSSSIISSKVSDAADNNKSKEITRSKQSSRSNNSLRLRTCAPILEHYCNQNQIANAIKLYHTIKSIPTVHLDKETYTMLISSCARNGYFCHYSPPIEGAAELGYDPGFGPKLFDNLASDMAKNILELCGQSVNQIRNGFIMGFQDGGSIDNHRNLYRQMIRNLEKVPYDCHLSTVLTPAQDDELVLNRVSIDDASSKCPRTDVKLRLIMLDDAQKKHMHDTLLKMADLQFVAYDAKLEAKGQKKSSKKKGNKNNNEVVDENYAGKHLESFADWLDTREGKPFTVIVDGANVAYFGLGSVNYHQVKLMLDALEKMGENPLVVMPQKYTQKKFYLRQGYVQELTQPQIDILDDLTSSGKLYEVPQRCLDDYYWMLSSVSNQTVSSQGIDLKVSSNHEGRWPGTRPILITNDQMRDHKLELIEPRLFRRWFSSHIVNYEFTPFVKEISEDREITFVKADSFSREIQSNLSQMKEGDSEGVSTWHIPVADWDHNDRFCVRIPQI